MLHYPRVHPTINIAIFIAYGLLITGLSLKPTVDVGDLPYHDKVAHLLAYAGFTFLAWRMAGWRLLVTYYAVGFIIYSGLIEFTQQFTGRSMSFYDLVANTLGVTLSITVLYFFERYHRAHKVKD